MFFSHLRTGDHVVVADVTYEATWRLFAELELARYGIEATFVDMTDLDAVRAICPNTRIVHVETIANPTTKVTDIAGGHDRDEAVILVVDSTFTPPPLYRPLEDGADLVVHSFDEIHQRARRRDGRRGDRLGRVARTDQKRGDGRRGRGDLPVQRLVDHTWFGDAAASVCVSSSPAWRGSPSSWAQDPRIAMRPIRGLPSHPQHEAATPAVRWPRAMGG